jgi:ribosomal protein L40E
MDFDENENIIVDFSLICPECGVGNPKNAENCMICDRDLKNIIVFLEDDPYDLEITEEFLIEYKKNFWGEERTGKITIYKIDKMEKIEFGSPISRFIFEYEGKRVVLPLREENMVTMKKFFKN